MVSHFWHSTRDSRFTSYIKRAYVHDRRALGEIVGVEARVGYVNITRYNALI